MKRITPLLAALSLAACGQPSASVNDQAMDNGTSPAVETTAAVATSSDTPATDATQTDTPTPAATAMLEADYLGRWTGVEGMYLVVTDPPRGGVELEMQYDLDHKGTYAGSVTAEGIRFMRNGVAEVLTPTDGDATGLKWLADKKDCLTVKPGEGYCRD